MYIEISKTHSNVISIELTNEKVTQEHIKKIDDTIAELHKKTDNLHFIVLVTPHTKISLDGILEVLKMAIKDRKFIRKVAIVGDSQLLKVGIAMDNAVLPWQEKYFDIDNLNDAWQWVGNEEE